MSEKDTELDNKLAFWWAKGNLEEVWLDAMEVFAGKLEALDDDFPPEGTFNKLLMESFNESVDDLETIAAQLVDLHVEEPE